MSGCARALGNTLRACARCPSAESGGLTHPTSNTKKHMPVSSPPVDKWARQLRLAPHTLTSRASSAEGPSRERNWKLEPNGPPPDEGRICLFSCASSNIQDQLLRSYCFPTSACSAKDRAIRQMSDDPSIATDRTHCNRTKIQCQHHYGNRKLTPQWMESIANVQKNTASALLR